MNKILRQAESDLAALMKLGSDAEKTKVMFQYGKAILAPFLASLGAAGLVGGVGYYTSKKHREQHDRDLAGSLDALAGRHSDLIKKSPQKFLERFRELTHISPTIAKNPTLAGKLLEKKINSGFNVDDIHKLTSIEANASRAGVPSPSAAARAGSTHALQTLVQTFGPDMFKNYSRNRSEMGKALSEIDAKDKERKLEMSAAQVLAEMMAEIKDDGQTKEGSQQRVSDECLGEMLAERYVMFKTAGVAEGFKALGSSLSHFAPALAIGGGLELMRHVLENRRIDALEQQADKNFKMIVRDSDAVKGSPETAQEAFNTLKAVAPSLAARPLVAKTFIEYVASQGRLAPETVQQLAEAENQVRGIGSVRGSFMKDLQNSMNFTKGFAEPKTIEALRKGPRKPTKGFLG